MVHSLCAIPIVEVLVGQLRDAGAQQVTLDRVIVKFLQKHARTMSTNEFDQAEKDEMARIAQAWKVPLR